MLWIPVIYYNLFRPVLSQSIFPLNEVKQISLKFCPEHLEHPLTRGPLKSSLESKGLQHC